LSTPHHFSTIKILEKKYNYCLEISKSGAGSTPHHFSTIKILEKKYNYCLEISKSGAGSTPPFPQ